MSALVTQNRKRGISDMKFTESSDAVGKVAQYINNLGKLGISLEQVPLFAEVYKIAHMFQIQPLMDLMSAKLKALDRYSVSASHNFLS